MQFDIMERGRCTVARVGDVVGSANRSYEVVEIDDYGRAVCRNLDPLCRWDDDLQFFDDLDIDVVVNPNDPALFAGANI